MLAGNQEHGFLIDLAGHPHRGSNGVGSQSSMMGCPVFCGHFPCLPGLPWCYASPSAARAYCAGGVGGQMMAEISRLLGICFSVIPRSVERSVDKPVDCLGPSGHPPA